MAGLAHIGQGQELNDRLNQRDTKLLKLHGCNCH